MKFVQKMAFGEYENDVRPAVETAKLTIVCVRNHDVGLIDLH